MTYSRKNALEFAADRRAVYIANMLARNAIVKTIYAGRALRYEATR